MRKIRSILLAASLALCGCQNIQETQEYTEADFTAAIVADLHYTSAPSAFNGIVPLEPLCKEVTDALIAQIIDEKPDVLIMLGDNTNNGREEDVLQLAPKLKKVKDAGIELIMIPGNHDYGQSSMKPYETDFVPLLKMDEKDTASFSYALHTHGVSVLAMDSSHYGDTGGRFDEKTMEFLEQQLIKAEERNEHVLFLSHHNVIAGIEESAYKGYLIQNDSLYDLLKKHHVRICLSGHQHAQSVYHHEDMYEILTGMPFGSSCSYGWLNMNETGVSYSLKQIDLETYGEETAYAKAQALIQKQSDSFLAAFVNFCREAELDEETSQGVLDLISFFFESYGRGTLEADAETIMNDPYYEEMMELLKDKNYGPWMERLLHHPPLNGSECSFKW